jgi:hypothetical protein
MPFSNWTPELLKILEYNDSRTGLLRGALEKNDVDYVDWLLSLEPLDWVGALRRAGYGGSSVPLIPARGD